MKCENCPLVLDEWNSFSGDGDSVCLVTGDYITEETFCKRTNRWILSQDREKLISKYYRSLEICMSEYLKFMGV